MSIFSSYCGVFVALRDLDEILHIGAVGLSMVTNQSITQNNELNLNRIDACRFFLPSYSVCLTILFYFTSFCQVSQMMM